MDRRQVNDHVERLDAAIEDIARLLAKRGAGPLGASLSPSQRLALRILRQAGPVQVSDVAASLNVTVSAATGMVDRLVRAGFATRERDKKDRRVVWVTITAAGQTALAQAESERRAAMIDLFGAVSGSELERLCEILERVVQTEAAREPSAPA